MFRTFIKAGLAAALLSALAAATPAAAQDYERNWEPGSVWAVSYVRTKPGQFNAYINDLSNVWRVFLDAQKEDGDVLSYKILSINSPRDGEANLLLLVEFKNMGVFDRGPAYFEELTDEIMGSQENLRSANIDRAALRDLMGGLVTREIHFADKE